MNILAAGCKPSRSFSNWFCANKEHAHESGSFMNAKGRCGHSACKERVNPLYLTIRNRTG